ncbi:MAG: cation/H(+) antiporter [Chitinophagaceae bacterium]|nr:MAG: cation/H(+) antiporter [Chitinophagaceae bacterium]
MKRNKNLIFYATTIIVFSAIIYFFIQKGTVLQSGRVMDFVPQINASTWVQFKDTFRQNLQYPLAILLLQILTIIIVARIFGFFCKKIGQPTVIGEIIAGIVLGPSFLGMYFPEYSGFLFPKQSLPNLQFLSQIGLILFMFVIGMELDLNVLKSKAKDAIVVSHASIIFPFTLGTGLAYFIYQHFAPANVGFLAFSLFMGIAMSITAFPVLARIVQERGLSKTKLGTIVITCAAADDITAWCILAVVIAIVKAGSILSALYTILIALAYVFIMLRVVQPFLKKIGDKYQNKESFSKPVVAIFFITLLLSSYATEVIGIHALFGAFMAGVIMPANASFRNIFIEKVEDVALVLLLPLFFVFTGLRTHIGLLNEPYLWQICAAIIAVAVIGKFLGSALAARFVGQSWADSLAIGALMNCRGLMELIVLNIGYDLGVLSPEIFAMMVIMALVTTFMTGPALDLINRFVLAKNPPAEVLTNELVKYNIIGSFSTAKKGVSILKMAHSLARRSLDSTQVTMLHVSSSNELNLYNQEEYERDSFNPILDEAKKLNLKLQTIFKPALDVNHEITTVANAGNYDLLLIGAGSSVFEGTFLGKLLGITSKIINPEKLYDTITGKERLFENAYFDDRVRQILRASKIPVGIYINKRSDKLENIFVPVYSISDSFLFIFAQKFINNSLSRVTIIDIAGVIRQNPELSTSIESIQAANPGSVELLNVDSIQRKFLDQQDLLLISMDSWRKVVEEQNAWLSRSPSVLIIKP